MKKTITKFLLLALVSILVLPISIKAAMSNNNDDSLTNGVITVKNAVEGQNYSVYRLLKLESYNTDTNAYRYTVTTEWKTFIESAAVKDVYMAIDEFGYVTWVEGADAAEFAKLALKYAKDNSIAATATTTASVVGEDVVAKFESLKLGYYLLDSSLGALCGLDTTNPTTEIEEKNSDVTVEKEVKENSTNSFGEKNDAKIGDIVEFKTTITVGKGAENYVLYDILSKGLTLLDSDNHKISVKVNGTEVDATNYTKTVNIENGTFNIAFNNEYTKTLTPNTEIIVSYYAVLNEDAVVEGSGNLNETYVTYGDNNETTHDYTRTYTYSFNLKKTDASGKELEGAEFRLYADEAATQEIFVAYDEEAGVYRVLENATEGEVIKVGTATIEGLDHKDYYLKETKQPEGYNILTGVVTIAINGTDLSDTQTTDITETYKVFETSVVNNTGIELPSTGGAGTALFITVGMLLVLGFGVLLVTKFRMSKMTI